MLAKVCTECGWFEHPFAPIEFCICPECGADVTEERGQYLYTSARKRWFCRGGLVMDNYIDFIPRSDEDAIKQSPFENPGKFRTNGFKQ